MPALIFIEVAYALSDEQFLRGIHVPQGATLREAIMLSGLLERYPALDLENINAGIYGKRKTLDTTLADGDRVEVYRPLLADPKEARRQRSKKR